MDYFYRLISSFFLFYIILVLRVLSIIPKSSSPSHQLGKVKNYFKIRDLHALACSKRLQSQHYLAWLRHRGLVRHTSCLVIIFGLPVALFVVETLSYNQLIFLPNQSCDMDLCIFRFEQVQCIACCLNDSRILDKSWLEGRIFSWAV